MIALWCGLGVKNLSQSAAGDLTADYDFSEKLFPELDDGPTNRSRRTFQKSLNCISGEQTGLYKLHIVESNKPTHGAAVECVEPKEQIIEPENSRIILKCYLGELIAKAFFDRFLVLVKYSTASSPCKPPKVKSSGVPHGPNL